MIKQILKTFLILGVFFAAPGFASAEIAISNGWPSGVLSSSTTSVLISFDTDQIVRYCRYALTPNTPFNSMTQSFGAQGTDFLSQKFDNISSGNTYHYYIKCLDTAWAANVNDYEISFSVAASPNLSISSVQGTMSNGQIITVNGNGFGIKSPVAPLMYDLADEQTAYSGLKDGDPLPVGAGKPWGKSTAFYKNTNPRGKNLAHYSNQWSASAVRNGIVGGNNFPEIAGKKMYLSYWIHTDTDFNPIIDELGNRNESNKLMRLTQDGQWFQQDTSSGLVWNPHTTSEYVGTGWRVTPTVGYFTMNIYGGWNMFGQIGAWNRNEIVVDNSTLPVKPRVTNYVNERMLLDYQIVNAGVFPQQDITGIASLGFDSSNSQGAGAPTVDFGEIYIDNTLARVEICNSSTKSGSNHCEIQIPQTTWNDGQLQIKINQGSFPDNSVAYLYVIDADGNVNANGKQITFGSSQASTCTDGIKNGSETGIDCGGSCAVCIQTYSISNLLTLVTNWLKTGTVSDVNSDGAVNVRDLGIMMSKWRN